MPVLPTKEERLDYLRRMARGEDVGDILYRRKAMPKAFNDWVNDNEECLSKMKSPPYFLRDNERVIKNAPRRDLWDAEMAWREKARQEGYSRAYTIGERGGHVKIHDLVNASDSDYTKLRAIAEEFARTGHTAALTPKMTRQPRFLYEEIYGTLRGTRYEGKCPDLNVDGLWYEHEGFITDNPKRAFKNMLNDGLKQSDRLVIDQPELTERYMLHNIIVRKAQGQHIKEVWVMNKERELRLLYKQKQEDKR